jgi:hypothetical protein
MAHPLHFTKKHARDNDSKDEKPPDRSSATSEGSGDTLASRPSEWSTLKARELLARPAVTQKTPRSLN